MRSTEKMFDTHRRRPTPFAFTAERFLEDKLKTEGIGRLEDFKQILDLTGRFPIDEDKTLTGASYISSIDKEGIHLLVSYDHRLGFHTFDKTLREQTGFKQIQALGLGNPYRYVASYSKHQGGPIISIDFKNDTVV